MTVTNQNFKIKSGDTKRVVIPITDENDQPLNLAGATARWIMSRGPGKENIIEKTSPVDIEIGATQITIKFAPADTADLKGKFYHEVEITEADESISTVTTGVVSISADL